MTPILILAAALQVAASSPAEQDIVVVGKRFDQTRGVLKHNIFTGKFSCSITRSSGDVEIDRGVCHVAVSCGREKKKRAQIRDCIATGRQQFLENYARMEQDNHAQD